jgi:hypothetical protein
MVDVVRTMDLPPLLQSGWEGRARINAAIARPPL